MFSMHKVDVGRLWDNCYRRDRIIQLHVFDSVFSESLILPEARATALLEPEEFN